MKPTIAILSLLLLFSCGKDKESVHPQRRDLTQAVYASGKLFPKDDYKVISRLSGYVQEIHVKAGDSVKVGQPLITIRSEVSDINVEAARNQLSLAQKNAADNGPVINSLKQELTAAKAKYELDSVNYNRYRALLQQNSASQLQADQAKVQFESSRSAYVRAQNNFTSTRDRLRTELENARLQLEAQTSNRGDYVISAAVGGKVYDVLPKVGDLVGPQSFILEIGSADEFEIELSVDETDISLVEPGQEVLYEIEAYHDMPLSGKVEMIYPRITPGNKTARVIASVALPEGTQVYSGMSVESNIIIEQKKNILVIPREYLKPGDQVKVKGKEAPVKVQTGAEDLEYIEVLSGVTESDELEK